MGHRLDDAHRPLFGTAPEQTPHRLAARALRQGCAPEIFNTQNLPEDNENFLARNEEAQTAQLHDYDEAEFWTNYQLLQAFDLISLFLCNKDVVDDYIEPVPTSYGERTAPGRLTLRTLSSNRIKIDPYPFDANDLRVQLIRRRLQQSTFADPAAFRQTYFKATPEALDFTFCAR